MLDEWLATFAFSRSLRHAPRDFSDAVLMAELLSQLLPPGAVGLHNYPSTGRYQQKLVNWDVLNRKVLTPIGCELSRPQKEALAGSSPNAIAVLLVRVKQQTDAKTPSSQVGKPPRSPTKKPLTTITDRDNSRTSAVHEKPTKATHKVANSRSASLSSMGVTRSASSRSVPSSPIKNSKTGSSTCPTNSPYKLQDYLPLASERPRPESLTPTEKSLFRAPCHRQEAKASSVHKRSAGTSGRSRSTSSCAVNRVSGSAEAEQLRKDDPKPILVDHSVSGSTVSSDPRQIDTHKPNLIPLQVDEDPASTDIHEGSFALLKSPVGDVEQQAAAHPLVRIVRSLSFDDYLVQLFKPSCQNQPMKSIADMAPSMDSFASTPHFIESSRYQLQPVSGYQFDPIANVWVDHGHATRPRAWTTSPRFTRPTSPLRDYTTTVLSRHKFGVIGLQSPIEVRSVEEVAKTLPTCDAVEASIQLSPRDLCATPTIFPPVQLDVTTLLESPPPRFSPSKKCHHSLSHQ